jgi:hypothetical protein
VFAVVVVVRIGVVVAGVVVAGGVPTGTVRIGSFVVVGTVADCVGFVDGGLDVPVVATGCEAFVMGAGAGAGAVAGAAGVVVVGVAGAGDDAGAAVASTAGPPVAVSGTAATGALLSDASGSTGAGELLVTRVTGV